MFTGVVAVGNHNNEGHNIVAGAWTMANTHRKRDEKSMEKEIQEENSGLPLLTEPCIQDTSNQLVTVTQIKPNKSKLKLDKGNKRIVQPSNEQIFGLESLSRNIHNHGSSLKSFAYAGKETTKQTNSNNKNVQVQ